MIRTVEGVIDSGGHVQLAEAVTLAGSRRVLVMILDEEPGTPNETALLSEASLSADWNRPEEDAAWSYLQPGK